MFVSSLVCVYLAHWLLPFCPCCCWCCCCCCWCCECGGRLGDWTQKVVRKRRLKSGKGKSLVFALAKSWRTHVAKIVCLFLPRFAKYTTNTLSSFLSFCSLFYLLLYLFVFVTLSIFYSPFWSFSFLFVNYSITFSQLDSRLIFIWLVSRFVSLTFLFLFFSTISFIFLFVYLNYLISFFYLFFRSFVCLLLLSLVHLSLVKILLFAHFPSGRQCYTHT